MYTGMIKVAVKAALTHAQSGQLLLGLKLLASLVRDSNNPIN
jgi:hypothetical protein